MTLAEIIADNLGPVKIYLTTMFGSCGMYVFSSYKGFDNSINFLRRMFPQRSETFYARADFFLMSISGSVIGVITFAPQGVYQALAAGFGWAGAMNVLLKTDPPPPPAGGDHTPAIVEGEK